MSRRFLKGALAASVMAMIAVLSVPAEAAQVECRVPFSFTVYETVLPPGRYNVSTEAAQGVLAIRGSRHGVFVLAVPRDSWTETDLKLGFYKYGDQYFLREVWMGGGLGREIPRSRLEDELIRTMQSAAVTPERVIVLAR